MIIPPPLPIAVAAAFSCKIKLFLLYPTQIWQIQNKLDGKHRLSNYQNAQYIPLKCSV